MITTVTPTSWQEDLHSVLHRWAQHSSSVVLSPDVDGLLSCALLATKFPVKVVGIYTTTHLLLLDGASATDAAGALWLDHDVSELGVRCVGQHLVHHTSENILPRREPESFNPNVWLKQSWKNSFQGRGGKKRDKYPFGTCHFLAHAFKIELGAKASELSALSAHADGTWRTVVDYAPNAAMWFDLMFKGDTFLTCLMSEWHQSAPHLAMHAKVVEKLVSLGVTNRASNAPIARLLPAELKALTGRQGVKYSPSNPQGFVHKIAQLLGYVAAQVDSEPQMTGDLTNLMSGAIEDRYPDKIDDFDAYMVDQAIFSHAFTDRRTLRFTTGIVLQPHLT